jgi:uncharacterized RDD family membrane protein YckC
VVLLSIELVLLSIEAAALDSSPRRAWQTLKVVYCPYCGAEAAADARFCRLCGKSLASPAAPPSQPPTAPAEPTASLPPRSAVLPSNVPTMDAAQASRPVEYAGFWRRFGALFIDIIILSVISLVLGFVIVLVFAVAAPRSAVAPTLAAAVILVIGILYYPVQETSEVQATLGKRALGIKVTDLEGRRVSFGRALGRNLLKILSGVLLFVGYLMAAFTARKQALHDIIAGCLVVRA